jgi:sigma-B regulation protein RsbU (phosphoserine phosphatase)
MRKPIHTNTLPHPELDYNAFCQCTAEGTGNFYDFIPRDCHRLAVSIGDLPFTGETHAVNIHHWKALVRGLTAGSHGDVAGLARELNGTLYLLGPQGLCAPWFYALLDPLRHELRYVNAGHEPPFLIRGRSGVVHRLERTGAGLGFSAHGIHHQETTWIEDGDILAIFSEGVADVLSEARVLDVLLNNPHAGAAELTRRVFEDAERYANRPWLCEDRTFAAVRVKGIGERPVFDECAAEDLMVCAA